MNKAVPGSILLSVGFIVLLAGCGDDSVTDCGCNQDPWATSPEGVVTELVASYRQRDIKRYSRLLAPEFVFKFQPSDAQQIGTDFWTRNLDSTGTEALFETHLVSQIDLVVIHDNAVPADSTSFPPGTMTIRLDQVQLAVDQTDGITWLVADLQDLFFRPGNPALGENPDLWFLVEWRDLPSLNAPGVFPSVQQATWGLLKARYE